MRLVLALEKMIKGWDKGYFGKMGMKQSKDLLNDLVKMRKSIKTLKKDHKF